MPDPQDGTDLASKLEAAEKTNRELRKKIDELEAKATELQRCIEAKTDSDASKGELEEKFNKQTLELKFINDQLAQEVAWRNQAEESLREHTRQLEDVNEELENYTYVVSHDLKEPLRSIGSFSQFIYEDYSECLDDTGKDYLRRIVAATERMNRLIDDLLKLSRIGRKDTEYDEVDLNQVLGEVKLDLTQLIKSRNAIIEVAGGTLPAIVCQRTWIGEVFRNLIGNSLKYNQSRQPYLSIGCREGDTEYVLWVKDNGVGIESKYLDRVFRLFERLDEGEADKGTGAGLAIVKSIIEQHGGKVWAESEGRDKGTTMKFTLPKRRPSKANDAAGP